MQIEICCSVSQCRAVVKVYVLCGPRGGRTGHDAFRPNNRRRIGLPLSRPRVLHNNWVINDFLTAVTEHRPHIDHSSVVWLSRRLRHDEEGNSDRWSANKASSWIVKLREIILKTTSFALSLLIYLNCEVNFANLFSENIVSQTIYYSVMKAMLSNEVVNLK